MLVLVIAIALGFLLVMADEGGDSLFYVLIIFVICVLYSVMIIIYHVG